MTGYPFLRRCSAALAAGVAMAAFCGSAEAIVIQNPTAGRVSYLPRNLTSGPPKARAAQPVLPLLYWGGPVMHSNTTRAIFWDPNGSLPTAYKSAVDTYLSNVAADSGKPTNVYSVGAQYTDSSGRAAYNSTFGGSITDTNPYPNDPLANCPVYTSGSLLYSTCLTDQQIWQEVNRLINANPTTLPRGPTTQYLVFLPANVGSCLDSSGASGTCFDRDWCGYHSFNNTGGTFLYAVLGFTPADPAGCGTQQYPNGLVAGGGADDVLSVLSHESNEMVTDPLINAWYDQSGNEDGDKCRLTSDDYGPPLGGSSGSLYNQLINGGTYYLQMEWSNSLNSSGGGCAQRDIPPVAAFSGPSTAAVGQTVSFDGSASSDADGTVQSWSWDFGDGSSGTGPKPSHAYSAAGTYTVALTVTDNAGYVSPKATQQIVVSANPALTVTRAGNGQGTVRSSDGSISCGAICTGAYPPNTQVTLTAFPAGGSTFTGWSGACSGTGQCTVTMSADRGVAATFTAIPQSGSGAPPAAAPSVAVPGSSGGGTGERAAALKKCKRKHGAKRRKCRRRASLLPL